MQDNNQLKNEFLGGLLFQIRTISYGLNAKIRISSQPTTLIEQIADKSNEIFEFISPDIKPNIQTKSFFVKFEDVDQELMKLNETLIDTPDREALSSLIVSLSELIEDLRNLLQED